MRQRRKTGGRVKGVPNKLTKAIKDMILGALDDVGGQKYLVQQAKRNPVAFIGLLGRILPHELRASVGGGVWTIHRSYGMKPVEQMTDKEIEEELAQLQDQRIVPGEMPIAMVAEGCDAPLCVKMPHGCHPRRLYFL